MSATLAQWLPRLAGAGARLSGAAFSRGLGAAAGRSFASAADLKKTPLHDLHVEHGGDLCKATN